MDKFASFTNVWFFHQNSLPQFCMTDAELIENMSQKKQNTEVIIIKISYFAAILKHSSLHMEILWDLFWLFETWVHQVCCQNEKRHDLHHQWLHSLGHNNSNRTWGKHASLVFHVTDTMIVIRLMGTKGSTHGHVFVTFSFITNIDF